MLKKFILGIVCAVAIVGIGSYKGLSEEDKGKKLEEKVVVYSNYETEVLDYIGKEFKESTGIEVEFKELNTSDKNIPNIEGGDVLLGGDKTIYEALKGQGKLLYNKPSWYDELSYNDKDMEGFWYGTSKIAIVPFVDAGNSSKISIKSWNDLGSTNIKGKLILKDTKSYDTYMMISAIVDKYHSEGDEQAGIDVISNIKLNINKFVENDSELFKEIQNKETPVGISNISSINTEKSKNNTNLTPIYPEEGIPIITQCIGISNTAENVNAAKLFVEFVAGPKMQLELANEFNIIPTNPVAVRNSSDMIKNLSDIKVLNLDLNNINKNKDKWIQTFNQVTLDKPASEDEQKKNEDISKNSQKTTKKKR